jgi:signal transduction histidine kinase
MREAGCRGEGILCEAKACSQSLRDDGRERIAQALHDLCQPLTTLQCRLELAGLVGTDEAYREAVRLALVECDRLLESVGSMREIVCAARA